MYFIEQVCAGFSFLSVNGVIGYLLSQQQQQQQQQRTTTHHTVKTLVTNYGSF
jgi:carbamate kinase